MEDLPAKTVGMRKVYLPKPTRLPETYDLPSSSDEELDGVDEEEEAPVTGLDVAGRFFRCFMEAKGTPVPRGVDPLYHAVTIVLNGDLGVPHLSGSENKILSHFNHTLRADGLYPAVVQTKEQFDLIDDTSLAHALLVRFRRKPSP
jgi:hypothetical protein